MNWRKEACKCRNNFSAIKKPVIKLPASCIIEVNYYAFLKASNLVVPCFNSSVVPFKV